MGTKIITTTFQLRRGNAQWYVENNPVLAQGEPVYELDTNKFKIGDGINNYNDLPYIVDETAIEQLVTELAIGVSGTGNNSAILGNVETNVASGTCSLAQGQGTISDNVQLYNTASGQSSHVEGENNTASGDRAHAEGYKTEAAGNASHTEGVHTAVEVNTNGGHAEGMYTVVTANYGHAEGQYTTAGLHAHAEGEGTSNDYVTATGQGAHAEGSCTTASGAYAHAEGGHTVASGIRAHAEGENTVASGKNAHAEGFGSTNYKTTASGQGAHAEGYITTASGEASHSEGGYCVANEKFSHAEGVHTTASAEGQHVCGKWNVLNNDALFIVGNGTSSSNKKNAFEVGNTVNINVPFKQNNKEVFLPVVKDYFYNQDIYNAEQVNNSESNFVFCVYAPNNDLTYATRLEAIVLYGRLIYSYYSGSLAESIPFIRQNSSSVYYITFPESFTWKELVESSFNVICDENSIPVFKLYLDNNHQGNIFARNITTGDFIGYLGDTTDPMGYPPANMLNLSVSETIDYIGITSYDPDVD